jgi:hypothetical protein
MCHHEINRELAAGEKVLWEGRPPEGIRLRDIDLMLIPFSLMWCGFAFFWEFSVITSTHGSAFFVAWGVPFMAIGVHMTVVRFFYDKARREKTCYAVTDQRVLIVETLFRRKVVALSLEELREMSYDEGWFGMGVVTLGACDGTTSLSYAAWPGVRRAAPPQLELTGNPRQVFELIRDAKNAAQRIQSGEVAHA